MVTRVNKAMHVILASFPTKFVAKSRQKIYLIQLVQPAVQQTNSKSFFGGYPKLAWLSCL